MSIFNTVPVKKPQMSAFDLSYNNYFTCDMGELIPALVLPVMPSDRIQYSPTFQVRFAPMLNPVFADIYAKVECFFVPYRLLWDSWKDYITGVNQSGTTEVPSKIPVVTTGFVNLSSALTDKQLDGIRIADFLGAKGLYRKFKGKTSFTADDQKFEFSCFPFRAYNLIWNEYYRDEFVDKPYQHGVYGPADNLYTGSADVYISHYGSFHRRWQKDYFTTATPNPQYGADASGVQVSISGTEVSDLKGFFTVAQFRVANALQRFLERTNVGGGRYNEFILAHFGCMPTDATIQRPEFLGSVTAPVQVSAVTQTSSTPIGDISTKSNTLGAQGGTASAVGTNMCFRRSFQEYGIILGLFSVFPKPVYSDGVSRYLACGVKGSRFDFGFPEFAGIGDQQIDKSELATWLYSSQYGIGFGYQQRYSEFKFMNDEVHGDFSVVDSGLAQYTFSRFFVDSNGTQWTPALNSSFLECTPRADCFVLKTSSDSSSPTVNQCWVQLRNNIKVIRALPKFSTPTL